MPNHLVRCGCGRGVAASGVDAGGEVPCPCGRRVAVPSLSQLRAEAGEPSASPELVIRAELEAGHLPHEVDCVGCGSPGGGVYQVQVVCEQRSVKSERPSLLGRLVLICAFGLAFVFLIAATLGRQVLGPWRERELGREVRFQLPVRACPACARSVPARDLLARTPLYARLLEKYPHATVGRAVG